MGGIENRWTWQGIAQLLGLFIAIATIIGIARTDGRENEAIERRITSLEESRVQAIADSRMLIAVSADMGYVKREIDLLRQDFRTFTRSAMAEAVDCSDDRPVLVASYCRSLPGP